MKNKSAGEIQALIYLLGDEDTHVRDVARERLFEFGVEAEQHLKQATVTDLEGKVRIEARSVLEKIRRDNLLSSFYLLGLLDDEQFDLEHAAFLLSQVGYPDIDSEPYVHELDKLAACVDESITGLDPHTDGRKIVRRMARVLFDEQGFRGNYQDYYDPDNSYLNRVLERRIGIPVSLSLVYLLVSKRLDLAIRGINLPVHFICRYDTPADSFFIDPFNKGRIITKAECVMLLRGARQPFQNSFLEPVTGRLIFARMIRNLIWIYYQQEEMEKMNFLDRLLQMLRAKE